MPASRSLTTRCCIAGGGPAGMMLGLILARAGIEVIVLEKHADFLRDFRGDTVHPSTLEILDLLDLMPRALPLMQRYPQLKLQFADGLLPLADFSGLKFPWMGFVPQWDFLKLLADEGARYPEFRLLMSTEATGLKHDNGRVCGLQARDANGELEIRSDLVVACDGRGSSLRAAAGLRPHEFGAPMDVLWFRISRQQSDPPDTFAVAGRGQVVAMLNRKTYWQVAFVIPKGGAQSLRERPLQDFRARLAQASPLLANRTGELQSWDDLKLLEVRVDCLQQWHQPGLLFIGDAAHAMSPVGGVGINLAIQDAVAAANILGPALLDGGAVPDALLAQVQQRREWPTRLMQWVQRAAQAQMIAPALQASGAQPQARALLRWLSGQAWFRAIPARIFGLGYRRERHVLPAKPR